MARDRVSKSLAHLVVSAIVAGIALAFLATVFGFVAIVNFVSEKGASTQYLPPVSQPVMQVAPTQPATSQQPKNKPSAKPSSSPSVKPKATKSENPKPVVQPAPPTRIQIPTIGVDANIGQVATTVQGGESVIYPPASTLADLAEAYWWNERAEPSSDSAGTTFIVGHTCHSAGCPAVFNSLQNISVGATIDVTTSKGKLTYKVTKTKTYTDTAGRSSVGNEVYADKSNSLVLVTCKLRGDGASQTDNFVVWAQLEGAKAI